jgi:hypothetical protein
LRDKQERAETASRFRQVPSAVRVPGGDSFLE